jgi:DASH complex subunit DAD3
MASETLDGQNFSASPTSQQGEECLSPLEQEVLDEYARLLGNLNTVCLTYPFHFSPFSKLLDTNDPIHPSTPNYIPFARFRWMLANASQMSTLLLSLSTAPSAAILDGLRGLERKTSLVFTLLKASVYSIVLNQQITDENDGAGSTAGGYNGGGRGAGENVYERLATAEEQEQWRREKEGRDKRRRDMDG